jgi:hypothetical protein
MSKLISRRKKETPLVGGGRAYLGVGRGPMMRLSGKPTQGALINHVIQRGENVPGVLLFQCRIRLKRSRAVLKISIMSPAFWRGTSNLILPSDGLKTISLPSSMLAILPVASLAITVAISSPFGLSVTSPSCWMAAGVRQRASVHYDLQ